MKEAAIGMGADAHAVDPGTCCCRPPGPGILTGVMLGVARAAGETAPLLFTALFSDYCLSRISLEPTPSLAVLIYNFSGSAYDNQIQVAWAASLVLVAIVLVVEHSGGQLLLAGRYSK